MISEMCQCLFAHYITISEHLSVSTNKCNAVSPAVTIHAWRCCTEITTFTSLELLTELVFECLASSSKHTNRFLEHSVDTNKNVKKKAAQPQSIWIYKR